MLKACPWGHWEPREGNISKQPMCAPQIINIDSRLAAFLPGGNDSRSEPYKRDKTRRRVRVH